MLLIAYANVFCCLGGGSIILVVGWDVVVSRKDHETMGTTMKATYFIFTEEEDEELDLHDQCMNIKIFQQLILFGM